jgi:glycosyltransferase involved in cell wall biosynthesis
VLSVIVPVYNEKNTVREILETIRRVPVEKEIVVVDDGSSDGTRKLVSDLYGHERQMRLIFHEKNAGKGKAIQTGIAAASGDRIIIQDADLEYDPADYAKLLAAMEKSGAHAVYGSRFREKKKVTALWHRGVNYFLTALTNVLYGSDLTDMETCYKLIRAETLKCLAIESDGFEIEAEITAKLLRRGERIVEVPIAYKGRSYHEGKKIGWKDGLKAVLALFRYRLYP